MKLTASQLVVIVATLAESLSDNTYTFNEQTRRKVLNHFSSLLDSIEVEVVTTPADPVTLTTDTGS